jgi:heterodisulfide reductase subunit C
MIDLREANRELWREISEVGDLRACFACGSCVSVCPASNADPPLLIRTLARMVVLGLEEELLDEDTPWTCVSCSKCEEICPMAVRPFELGLAIRRWQCRNDETRIPPSTAELYKRGYTQAVQNSDELRASVGLTERLPLITDNPELLAKFRAMLMSIEIVADNDYMYEG